MRTPRFGARPTLALAAVTSSISGLLALVLGAATLSEGLNFASKLTGAFVFIASVLMWAGAVAAVILLKRSQPRASSAQDCSESKPTDTQSPKPPTRPFPPQWSCHTATVGAFAALVFWVMMALTQIWTGDIDLKLIFWLVGVASTGTIMYLLNRVRVIIPSPNMPRKLLAGLGLATLVSLGQFVYTQLYLPGAQLPALSIKAELGTPSHINGQPGAAVPITFTVKVGSAGLYLLDTTYTVEGVRAVVNQPGRTSKDLRSDLETDEDPSATTTVTGRDFLQEGMAITPGSQFPPSSDMTTVKTILLPDPAAFTSLQLHVHVDYLRSERAKLGDLGPTPLTRPDADYIMYSGKVDEGNPIFALTRRPVFVHIWSKFPHDSQGRPKPPDTSLKVSYDPKLSYNPKERDLDVQEVGDKVYERYSEWTQDDVVVAPISAG